MRYGYEFTVAAVTGGAFQRLPLVSVATIEKAARRRVPRDVWVDDRGVDRYVDDVVAELDRPTFGPDPSPTTKRGEVVAVRFDVPILKMGTDEERFVMGIVLEPTKEMGQPDTQGDVYSAEAVAKAADRFMENQGKLGIQHAELAGGRMKLLRSWVTMSNEEINGQPVTKGTWMMAVRIVDDQLWADTKAGKFTGFSIGGTATRTPRAA